MNKIFMCIYSYTSFVVKERICIVDSGKKVTKYRTKNLFFHTKTNQTRSNRSISRAATISCQNSKQRNNIQQYSLNEMNKTLK